MSIISEDVRTTVDELLKTVSTENVISEPYEVGDRVILTIIKLGLGFGTGRGETKNSTGPAGGATGGAVGVSPVAIVVIDKSTPGVGGVAVKSLAPPSALGEAISDVTSAIMQGIGEYRAKKQQQPAQPGEKQPQQASEKS